MRFRLTALCLALVAATPAWPQSSTGAKPLEVSQFDPAISPCTDLYAHVNGKWLASTEIPADRSRWGAFIELDKRNEDLLQSLLDKASTDTSLAAGSAARKAAEFYASGMDTAAIEAAGLAPLEAELKRIDALASRSDLAQVLGELQRASINAGFAIAVSQDAKKSTRYIPDLNQGGLGLPERDFYFRSDAKSQSIRKAYREHIQAMFELLGEPKATAQRNAATVLAFETRLAKSARKPEKLRDPIRNYNLLTLPRLTGAAPGLDWPRYFAAIGLAEPGEFNLGQPEFFKAMAQAARSAPLAEWKTYLRWRLLDATATKLPQRFEDERFRFFGTALEGKKEQRPRARRIIATLNGNYGEQPLAKAVGELYVAAAFPPEAKARALEMVENIRAGMAERIRGNDWMSEATKTRALHKLAAMNVKIGYPDKPRDYSALTIQRSGYLANWLAANRFEHERQLAKLGKPIDRSEWLMSPQIVNAYYDPTMNEIVFPAAILQPPFFDAKADDAVNYGGIGMVIGHEITHGFDDQGRQFDAQGNLKDWWAPEDARRYQERTAVIDRQFSAYEAVDGLKLNGKLTMGENIADLGGLRVAYLALQKALEAKGDAGPIDGLTQNQRFFLSLAMIWREKTRPERERVDVTSDPHSPPRFRVRGPVANMPEFAQAFACKPGDPAALRTASERVNIW